MVTITIDGVNKSVKKDTTVLQACNFLNIDIPKFCFQENLEIAGNCRMCLVEIKNSPKPVASCATPVMEGMQIFTNTPLVKKARESVLEFLLINHPLDCPICDQGGECDLQDQTLYFGSDRSRYFELKRVVEDKNCGPFIKTIMTRCIHCTRCVRFANEICGIDNLGTTGRGNKTEISFYTNNVFNSEFSGNIIDLCPVGALTSKPFAFKARSWELKKKKSIDILDGIGSNLVVQTFNNNVVRILPKPNKNINIEWITNKARFFFDSIKYQRNKTPLLKENGNFKEITWEKTFEILKDRLFIDPSQQKVFIGNLIDIKSLYSFKNFLNHLGINNIEYSTDFKGKANISSNIMSDYTFNKSMNNLSKSDLCLLVSCDPRKEGSILNLNLRNNVKKNNLQVFSIGNKLDLTYSVNNLGLDITNIIKILEGKHSFCQNIMNSKNFTIIVGSQIYDIPTGPSILDALKNRFNDKVNVLQLESGLLNFLEIFNDSKKSSINAKVNILYNTDNIKNFNKNAFNVYIGHHFTQNAQESDLILPTTTFLEKSSYYLNTEGLFQKTNKVLKETNQIKNDINLFFNLNSYLNLNSKSIYFNDIFGFINNYENSFTSNKSIKNFLIGNNINKPYVNNLYMTNILEKNSKVLMNSIKNTNNTNFTL